MKKKKQKRTPNRWFKILSHFEEHSTAYTIGLFFLTILLVPVIVLVCAGKIEIVGSEIDAILGYFGVALGIFSPAVTYLIEQRRVRTEKEKELRPRLQLEFETVDSDEKAYIMTITNRGSRDLSEIWIDGESTGLHLNAKEAITVNLDCNEAQGEWFCFDNTNKSIFLPSGKYDFPKTVGICCTDEDDRIWCVEFAGYHGACGPVYTKKDMYRI